MHTWAVGKSSGFFCLYLYVISFDFDSGVGIPVTLLFGLGGGKHPSEIPPVPMRDCMHIFSDCPSTSAEQISVKNVVECLKPFALKHLKAANLKMRIPYEGDHLKTRETWFEKLLKHPEMIPWFKMFNIRVLSF